MKTVDPSACADGLLYLNQPVIELVDDRVAKLQSSSADAAHARPFCYEVHSHCLGISSMGGRGKEDEANEERSPSKRG